MLVPTVFLALLFAWAHDVHAQKFPYVSYYPFISVVLIVFHYFFVPSLYRCFIDHCPAIFEFEPDVVTFPPYRCRYCSIQNPVITTMPDCKYCLGPKCAACGQITEYDRAWFCRYFDHPFLPTRKTCIICGAKYVFGSSCDHHHPGRDCTVLADDSLKFYSSASGTIYDSSDTECDPSDGGVFPPSCENASLPELFESPTHRHQRVTRIEPTLAKHESSLVDAHDHSSVVSPDGSAAKLCRAYLG